MGGTGTTDVPTIPKPDVPAILLGRTQHRMITKELLQLLPKGVNYTKNQILDAYRIAYRNYPEFMKAAEKVLK